MARGKRVVCLGCRRRFVPKRKPRGAPTCPECRKDSAALRRIQAAWRVVLQKKMVEEEAEEATRNLPKKDAFNPLVGEAMVLKMLRGEW